MTGKPQQLRRIPNVVGIEATPRDIAAALYPYRDFEEVQYELRSIQNRDRHAGNQERR